MRSLLRFLEEFFPALLDDILRHLDTVWDVLGLFGPLVAVVVVTAIAVGASYLQERWLARRLVSMRAAARADEALQPTLEITPRLKGLRRIFKPGRRILSIRLDHTGIAIRRQTGVAELTWTDVTKWSRDGLAEWTLWDSRGKYSLALNAAHGLTDEQLKRIDNRVALHASERPRSTLRDQLSSAKPFRLLASRVGAKSVSLPRSLPDTRDGPRPQGHSIAGSTGGDHAVDQPSQ